MTTNTKESLLVASGGFVLTAGCIEMLRWFGYIKSVSPLFKTSLAAAIGAAMFFLVYYLKTRGSTDNTNKKS